MIAAGHAGCSSTTGARHRGEDTAQQLLHHEAAHPRARVEHGQDEERLEHDREVVPDAEQPLAAERAAEDVRHAHRERRRAAGAVEQRLLADARAPAGAWSRGRAGSPSREIVAAACSAVAPTMPAGLLIAK